MILGLGYLMVHGIACFIPSPLIWGFDVWRYWPSYIGWILALAGLSIVFPIRNEMKRSLILIRDRIKTVPIWIWLVMAGLIFYLFRQATFFLGDGMLRIRNAELGHFFSTDQPMTTLFHAYVFRLFQMFGIPSGRIAYQAISLVCGIATLGGSIHYLKKLSLDENLKWMLGLLIVSTGALQFYFGYVESYTISTSLILLFLLSSMVMLETRKALAAPAMYLSLGMIFHPTGILFGLGFLYAYGMVFQPRIITSRWIKPFGIFLVAILVMFGLFYLHGITPLDFIRSYGKEGNLKPLFSRPEIDGILSWTHLIDIINQLALAVPTIIGLPVIFMGMKGHKRSPWINFLILSCIGPLVFLCIFNPKLGFARDWDILAVIAYPITLLVGIGLIQYFKHDLYPLAFTIIVISLLHTIPWIALNSSRSASIARFETLITIPHWSNFSKATARDELGIYYRDRGENEKALPLFKEAYNLTYNNRYLLNAGKLHYLMKDYRNSLSVFEFLAGMKDSLNYEVPFYLASTYQAIGEFPKAIHYYHRSLQQKPDESITYFCLGYAYLETGDKLKAEQYAQLAIRYGYDPSEVERLMNRIRSAP